MKIDLGGPDGNGLALMCITNQVARAFGMSKESAEKITSAMQAGTYIDLLNVMDQEFPGVFEFLGDPRVKA
jgi:hypothetical protein